MKKLEADCIDLTITSPPYDALRVYNGFEFRFEEIAEQLLRVTKPGGVVVWIVNDATVNGSETGNSFRQALHFKEIGFRIHDTMIYRKTGTNSPQSNRYYPCFEFMFVFSKGKPSTVNLLRDRPNKGAGRKRQAQEWRYSQTGKRKPCYVNAKPKPTPAVGVRFNIWQYNAGWSHTAPDELWKNHPAAFPLQLATDHVLSWSNPGQLVFDPMAGSGQVLIAAEQTGRDWLGMECSREYCELIGKRQEWFRENRQAVRAL